MGAMVTQEDPEGVKPDSMGRVIRPVVCMATIGEFTETRQRGPLLQLLGRVPGPPDVLAQFRRQPAKTNQNLLRKLTLSRFRDGTCILPAGIKDVEDILVTCIAV